MPSHPGLSTRSLLEDLEQRWENCLQAVQSSRLASQLCDAPFRSRVRQEAQRKESARLTLATQLEQMAVQLEDAEQEIEELRAVLERLVEEGVHVEGMTAAKNVDGVVLAVSPSVNQLILSVGKDDGVQVGDEFVVSRGDAYVGKVIVEKVYPDMCAARSRVDLQKLPILEGDRVATRP